VAWPGLAFYAGEVETLTFLFTDIEGSTALLGRLGDDLYAAMAHAWTMGGYRHTDSVSEQVAG